MSTRTPTDTMARNIQHAFDLIGSSLVDPAVLDKIPDGATVVLLSDDDPELIESNLAIAVGVARDGANIYLLHTVSREQVSRQ